MKATILFRWFLVMQCLFYVSPTSEVKQGTPELIERTQKHRADGLSKISLNSLKQCVVKQGKIIGRMQKRWSSDLSKIPLNLLRSNLRNGLNKECIYFNLNGKKYKWPKNMKGKDTEEIEKLFFNAILNKLVCIGYCIQ